MYNSLTKQVAVASCIECGIGQYADGKGLQSCKLCPTGRYSDEKGTEFKWFPKTTDPIITYVTKTEKDSNGLVMYLKLKEKDCKGCPAGKKTKLNSNGVLITGSGTSSDCRPCLAGKYSLIGSFACTNCPAGFYRSLLVDPGQCYACPIGRYSTKEGVIEAWDCLECAVGMYNDQVGMQICKGCAKGTYSDKTLRSKTKILYNCITLSLE